MAGKKMCLMFTGKDGCGVQCGGHSACIFPLLSAREAGVPGAHSFNKYLLRFLCSGLHARCFDFTVLAYGGQSLGSRWNSDQVVQVKGFRII